jgi:hypothetical protein
VEKVCFTTHSPATLEALLIWFSDIKPQKITNQEQKRNTNSASKPELESWVCSIGKRCANKQSRPCFVKGRFFIGGPV